MFAVVAERFVNPYDPAATCVSTLEPVLSVVKSPSSIALPELKIVLIETSSTLPVPAVVLPKTVLVAICSISAFVILFAFTVTAPEVTVK